MTRSITRVAAVAAMLILPGLVACDGAVGPARPARARSQDPAEFSSVRLPGVRVADARPAALQVLTERFRLDTSASTGTLLVSRPLETSDRADDERAGVREVLSGSSGRRRQIAQIVLVDRGEEVLVRCHVQVQRLDLTERGVFMGHRAADDRPGTLQGERSSGNRPVTEQDWVNVGRDRHLERNLLNQIAERLAPQTTGTPAQTRPQ